MEDILDNEAFSKDKAEFKTYKSFGSTEEAAAYIDLLKEHNISYSAESPEQLLDSVIIGEGVLPKVILKIYSGDFMRVNSIIAQQIEQSADDLETHHLNQLDNEELREILEKPDESSVEAAIRKKKTGK